MSKINWQLAERSASASFRLALFMNGETQLNESEFEGLQDELLALLEESNNHRYRFGRTRPRDDI